MSLDPVASSSTACGKPVKTTGRPAATASIRRLRSPGPASRTGAAPRRLQPEVGQFGHGEIAGVDLDDVVDAEAARAGGEAVAILLSVALGHLGWVLPATIELALRKVPYYATPFSLGASACAVGGLALYAGEIARHWIDVTESDVSIPGLARGL